MRRLMREYGSSAIGASQERYACGTPQAGDQHRPLSVMVRDRYSPTCKQWKSEISSQNLNVC